MFYTHMLAKYKPLCQQLLDNQPADGIITKFNLDTTLVFNEVYRPISESEVGNVYGMLECKASLNEIADATGLSIRSITRVKELGPGEKSNHIRVVENATITIRELLEAIMNDPDKVEADYKRCFDNVLTVLDRLNLLVKLSKPGALVAKTLQTQYTGSYRIRGVEYKFKSPMEAKFACWLQKQQDLGTVLGWKYEPTVFELVGEDGKTTKWRPDFVADTPGGQIFYEIKWHANARISTKLALMAQQYPLVKIKLIDAAWEANHSRECPYNPHGWHSKVLVCKLD